MLSRLADSLFWMTRYVERTDGILRMLKINFITALDRSAQADFNWQPVLQVFTNLEDDKIAELSRSGDDVLRYMISNRDNHNSIRNIIARARENARGMQDHITKEVWESMNEFYHLANDDAAVERAIECDEQIVMLDRFIERGLMFYGVAEVTMPRGQGWNYMTLGKLVERGIQTADILDVKFSNIDYDLSNAADVPYWRNLLLSLSGYELYLKTYRSGLDSRNVADLAILNTSFPRSLLYSAFRLERTIHALSSENLEATDQLRRIIGRLRSKIEYSDLETISEMGLHDYLKDVKKDFLTFSDALSHSYFAYN